MTGLGLLLLIHIGELASQAWGMRRLPTLIAQADASVGRPLALPLGTRLERRRLAVARSPGILSTETAQWLADRYPQQSRTAHVLAADPASDGEGETPGEEQRMLATVNGWAVWLRLAAGL